MLRVDVFWFDECVALLLMCRCVELLTLVSVLVLFWDCVDDLVDAGDCVDVLTTYDLTSTHLTSFRRAKKERQFETSAQILEY